MYDSISKLIFKGSIFNHEALVFCVWMPWFYLLKKSWVTLFFVQCVIFYGIKQTIFDLRIILVQNTSFGCRLTERGKYYTSTETTKKICPFLFSFSSCRSLLSTRKFSKIWSLFFLWMKRRLKCLFIWFGCFLYFPSVLLQSIVQFTLQRINWKNPKPGIGGGD